MPKVELNAHAPDFSLEDYSGREINLRDYRGKNIILVFNRGFL
jgi:peroxiredoxin